MFTRLINTSTVNNEIFKMEFNWPGAVPLAGQFFMVKPERTSVFLARPISVAGRGNNTVVFLISRRGRGTEELAAMRPGEQAELIGPLGNAWADFLPAEKYSGRPVALVGGGIGIAPLLALIAESSGHVYDLYAGFRTGFTSAEEKNALLGAAVNGTRKIIIATEDGSGENKGRIPSFLEPDHYAAVCACGPEPMLKAVAEKCAAAAVPCFLSVERRMGCGVGACLGCTIKTVNGNRRCCADGPTFPAEELLFDE